MVLVTVAGTALPTPSQYEGTHVDVVDSGRNAQGVIVSDIVRQNIAKIECKWNYLTLSKWAAICALFKNSWSNSVTFLDQTTGGYSTAVMYVSDRKTGGAVSSNGTLIGWKNCSLSLIEV